MGQLIAPQRIKYDYSILLCIGLTILGAIPMGFCKSLEGFFLIYFVVYISFVVLSIVLLLILFPYVRKKEIEFFSKLYSTDFLDKHIFAEIEKEDNFTLPADKTDIQFFAEKLKILNTGKECSYQDVHMYANYQCNYTGEMYKVFVYFVHEDEVYTFQMGELLYSLIKVYNLKVENLENVLNNCEQNIKNFLKDKQAKKEAYERNKKEDLQKVCEPILKALGEKATFQNYELTVNYHNNFVINYDFSTQKFYINNKYLSFVEEQDLLEFLLEIDQDAYYIVEYQNKTLHGYFKFVTKRKHDFATIKKSKNTSKIFDINTTLYTKLN